MNIWEAYCNHGFYNIYFDLLVAKGMEKESAENLKALYFAYLQRIKGTVFAQELQAIDDPDVFLEKLHDIFEVKWKDNLKYKELPPHFYRYMKFLESMEALHNKYFNEAERERIEAKATNGVSALTEYEREYMKGGKLVALMNPGLLKTLHELIVEENLAPKKATLVCRNFYGNLLDMSPREYATLINDLWHPTRQIKKGGKHNKIVIAYPDGGLEPLTTLDALKKIVLFYGFEEVRKKKLLIRGTALLAKYVPVGQESVYEKIGESMYILNIGNTKDRMNVARTINKMMGGELKICME